MDKNSLVLQTNNSQNQDEKNPDSPDMDFVEISAQDINTPDYPELWQAFLSIDDDWINISADANEWEHLQGAVFREVKNSRVVLFREKIIRCTLDTVKSSNKVLLTFVKHYNPAAPVLHKTDLEPFPGVFSVVHELIQKGDKTELAIEPKVWKKFSQQLLSLPENENSFYYNGIYFTGYYDTATQTIEGEIKHLQIILKLLGVLLLLIGWWQFRTLRASPKYSVTTRKRCVVYNTLSLFFLIPTAFLFVNQVLQTLLFVVPVTDNPALNFSGSIIYILGLVFFPAVIQSTIQKDILGK